MGVDAPVVNIVGIVGIHFDSVDEAQDFIRDHYQVDDDFEIDEFDDIAFGIEWQMASAYANNGGVIGVCVIDEDFDELGTGIKSVWAHAKELLPIEVHSKIKFYSWAQYH